MAKTWLRKGSYPLYKSRHILKWVFTWYKKKGVQLSPVQLAALESDMSSLDNSLLHKQREQASEIAQRLEEFGNINCKRTVFDYSKELILALLMALIIATLVRQIWFEPYEIPTGSMRPTFREQDHLTVTKTAFGINFPLETSHLYFDPALVQRTSIVIFSGDKLPLPDTDSTYFGIFPYKKRYIKRLLGKPGDSFYFYGGLLYSVDREGHDLPELRNSPWMQTLEHIPFLSFEGDMVSGGERSIIFRQMHNPTGKLTVGPNGQLTGEVFNGKKWVKDEPIAQKTPHQAIETYSDILGIRNYAEARLLTKEELLLFSESVEGMENGLLYLQLHHTPSLNYPKPLILREGSGVNIGIQGYSTIIPLQERHLDALMKNLYTARFIISDGKAKRYDVSGHTHITPNSPSFPGVPDGTYEFYFGQGSRIQWAGIPTNMSHDNPLYSHTAENVQKLFNFGIEMNTIFSPLPHNQTLFPHRYAYFREGDLYLMGAPIIKKDDETMVAFHKREQLKEEESTLKSPYVAFKDYGPPIKEDGSIDSDFIRTFGMTIPDKQYLVLGDNHAMSADSRVFGFVPQSNLQGAPCWIVWPPGDRLGSPPQKPYPFMNLPRGMIWMIVALVLSIWYFFHRRSLGRRIFYKINFSKNDN